MTMEVFGRQYAPILQKIRGNVCSLSKSKLDEVVLHSQVHIDYLHEKFAIDFSGNQTKNEVENTFVDNPQFFDSIADIIYSQSEFFGKIYCLETLSTITSNQETSLQVEVFNNTHFKWLSEGSDPINLSYHWQTKTSENVVFDGLRTVLPEQGITGGSSLKTKIQVETPSKSGTYILVLTLLKENVCWFENHGFEAEKITVQIV